MNTDGNAQTVGLDPRTRIAIAAFGRRRRRLIIERGVFAALAAWLAALTLIALADFVLLLEDGVRYGLSAAAHLLAAGVLWHACLRRLGGKHDLRELARVLESARPDLREDLLSAVELGEGDAAWDSPVFRRLLQEDVGRRVLAQPVEDLLPFRLIAKYARMALFAMLAVVALLFVPGLQYSRLLLRALVPAVNIERVSRTKIEVVAPVPADALVPWGEAVEIVARLSGAAADEVVLESLGAERGRVRMKPLGDRRFAATVQVGQDSLRYRIRGGDALTRKYLLTACPPPRVVAFVKEYRYPAYTTLAMRSVTEPSGDLDGIEGTEVALSLQLDQPVRSGELRFDFGEKKETTPLTPSADGRLHAVLRLERAGTYHVNLVAARTGFENRFSPIYELRVTPDLVPAVTLEKPEQDIVVSPDALVDLAASAQDDLGLVSLARAHQVNRGPWQSEPAQVATGRETRVEQQWDLISLNLKPGDQVLTKYVAKDLKGSTGESTVRRLIVSAPGFGAERMKTIEARREVQKALERLADAGDQVRKAVDENSNALKQPAADPTARRQALMKVSDAVEAARQASDAAMKQVKEALKQAPSGQAAQDLAIAGKAVSRIRHDALDIGAAQMERAATEPADPRTPERIDRAGQELRKVEVEARQAERAMARMLEAEEADVAAQDLEKLSAEERRLADAPPPDQGGGMTPEQRQRRQQVAASHADNVAATLDAMASTDQRHREDLRRMSIGLKEATEQVRREMEATPPGEAPRAPLDPLRPRVDQARDRMFQLAQELRQSAAEVRHDLDRRNRDANGTLQSLESAVQQMAYQAPKAGEAERRELAARAADERDAAAARLRDRAALDELRRDADPAYVRDTGRAAAAVDQTPAEAAGDEARASAAKLKEMAAALRTLEAGNDLAESAARAATLAAQERWDRPDSDDAMHRAREWSAMNDQLPDVERAVREIDRPRDEASQLVGQAARSPEANTAKQEMAERWRPGRQDQEVARPMESVAAKLADAKRVADPAVKAAREALAAMAPTLADQLRQLQRETAGLKEQTGEAAQKADQSPVDVRPEARERLAGQEDLNAGVDDVRAALRQDAAAQDMAQSEGRERARDADDALGMLRDPPGKAEDNLRRAAASPDRAVQAGSLDEAQGQQQKLEDALGVLAEHYDRLEKGDAEATRAALRAKEAEAGLSEQLDNQYDKAGELAQMAGKTLDEQIAALERELPSNPDMRAELDGIADRTLDDAASDVRKAAEAEKGLSQKVNDLARQTGEAEQRLAARAADLARRAGELDRNKIQPAAKKAQENQTGGSEPLAKASQSTQAAAHDTPRDLSGEKGGLAQQMDRVAQELRDAQQQAGSAAEQARQGANQAAEAASREERAAQQAKVAAEKGLPGAAEEAARRAEAANQARQSAQQAQGRAEPVVQGAQDSSGEAGQLATEASAIANELRQLAASQPQQLQQASGQQAPVTEMADEAGQDIARAGRHESRLGHNLGEAIQQAGERTEGTADHEMTDAGQAMASQPEADAAAPAVAEASEQIAARAQEIADLQTQADALPAPAEARANGGEPASDAAGRWMARALDQLDALRAERAAQAAQAAKGQPTPPSQGTPTPAAPEPGSAAARELAQAARAQAAAMAQARAAMYSTAPPSKGDSAQRAARAGGAGADVEVVLVPEDWAKLPAHMARDLMDAKRDSVPEEYRQMVDVYFKAIANDAQKGGKK